MNQLNIHSPESLTTVSMELASTCNLRCVMCSHHTSRRPAAVMSFDDFKQIVNKLQRTKIRDIFLNMGEPFMNKNIFMMISHARRSGFSVFISTNGLLLSESHINNIIKTGVNTLKFSIEGYTAPVYEGIRAGGNFERLLQNVRLMKETRDRTGTSPRIRISTIMLKGNENLVEFVKFWGPYCDEIEFTGITNHIGSVDNSGLALSPAWKHRQSCPQIKPYREINILCNGDMVICCVDFHGRCVLGNLVKQEFAEIWYSEKMTEIREKADADKIEELDPCRTCLIADYSGVIPVNLRRAVTIIHESVKHKMFETLEQIHWTAGTGAVCHSCRKPIDISFGGVCLECIEQKARG